MRPSTAKPTGESTCNKDDLKAAEITAAVKVVIENMTEILALADANEAIQYIGEHQAELNDIFDNFNLLTDAFVYKGNWDATGSFPSLPRKGDYYRVSVAGNGYEVADGILYNGSTWDHMDNSDKVASVNGRTGEVTLSKSDVKLGNVDNTADVDKPVSTATQTALDNKVDSVAGRGGDVVLTKSDVGLGSVDNTSDVNKPISTAVQTALDAKLDDSQKGSINGLAELDGTGKLLSSQLPSYVDDVLEYASLGDFPATGTSNTIYVTLDTNLTYRWTGSAYTEISKSLALGETSSTAYRGDRGKTAYDHTSNTSNPHGVTKSQVGLGNVDNTSDLNKPISTAQASVNQVNLAMTKAEFFALAEQRKSQSAGSGFRDWGKHASGALLEIVNEGVYTRLDKPNVLLSGYYKGIGKSNVDTPIVVVNGVNLTLESINYASTGYINEFKFPPAPDGTKTYDSSTGTVTQHASAAIAFAAETATNKVITSRQDFVFIEPWHEKISDKGVVYPLGNVQYGATNYDGITLAVNGIAQGYSAFGEWDSTTTGNCAVWANLTDAQKATFIQDHKNNIYSDNGELIQVRYRVRVVEGLGDNWSGLETEGVTVTYPSYGANRLKARGSSVVVRDLGVNSNAENQLYGKYSQYGLSELQGIIGGKGHYISGKVTGGLSVDIAHDGLCFAIPLCLVQRRNQGAYHPAYNPSGSRALTNDIGDQATSALWFNIYGTTKPSITSKGSLFSPDVMLSSTGHVTGLSGRPDDKFYDVIYASDVKDLRMSSKKLPLKEIREKYKRMAIAGEVRGFEGVPFTRVLGAVSPTRRANASAAQGDFSNIASIGDTVTIYDATSGAVVVSKVKVIGVNSDFLWWLDAPQHHYERLQGHDYYVLASSLMGHKQANPTWTDIIGSPANIAATFPDGVQGQWIPDFTSSRQLLNRKAVTNVSKTHTYNNGDTWANTGSVDLDVTTNTVGIYQNTNPYDLLQLVHYETQAHFTQDDVNSKVLDLGGVTGITANDGIRGNFLLSSLINKVATGYIQQKSTLTVFGLASNSMLDNGFWDGGRPTHNELALTDNSTAVKTLSYLSSENGVAKLCYAYKEMVYDDGGVGEFTDIQPTDAANAYSSGTRVNMLGSTPMSGYFVVEQSNYSSQTFQALYDSGAFFMRDGDLVANNGSTILRSASIGFGDNNKFEIADNQNTMTDDNGNLVKYGTSSFSTQYFVLTE